MKRAILLPVLITLFLLLSLLLWLKRTALELEGMEWIQLLIMGSLVVFGLFVVFRRWRSVRRREPVDDEFTRQVMRRASSFSYFISLYIWVLILILKDRIQLDMEIWLGTGILSMAVCFVLSWLFLMVKGMRHDQ